jgi:DNA-binding response OmpR family regulator
MTATPRPEQARSRRISTLVPEGDCGRIAINVMRLLLAEDSERLRQTLATAFRRSGYALDETGNGTDALWMAKEGTYDAIILDIMLPGMDGLAVLDDLRKSEVATPVLLLTARDSVPDRVLGLQTGADDYLPKPFALEELLARVQALCRRNYGKRSSTLTVGDLILDTNTRTARRGDASLDLTAREYALLEYLALRAGEVVSRTEIEAHIYDELVSPLSNVVDSAICTLRGKLAVSPDSAPLIHTRRGQGYLLGAP